LTQCHERQYFNQLVANKIFKKIRGNHKNQAVNLQTNVINVVKRFYKIIVFAAFCFRPGIISAQNQVNITCVPVQFSPLKGGADSVYKILKKLPTIGFQLLNQYKIGHNPVFSGPAAVSSISKNYYTMQFGFFCKKELQLEKRVGIPVRVRLGSLEYVKRLEGKGMVIAFTSSQSY
jgi:hypothetical protein